MSYEEEKLDIESLLTGVGLAIGCVLIAKVCFESAYDSFYKDIDRIYIIKTGVSRQGAVNDFNQISGGVAPGFKQYVPGVEYATRTTFLFESDKYYTEDRRQVSGKLVLADTSFSMYSTGIFWKEIRFRSCRNHEWRW